MKADIWYIDIEDPRFAADPMFFEPRGPNVWPRWPEDYRRVAVVDLDECGWKDETALEAAQTAWSVMQQETSGYDGIPWLDGLSWVKGKDRSMMSGDVVSLPDGSVFRVLAIGWQEITALEQLSKEGA